MYASLDALRSTIYELKAQSDTSFGLTHSARASLADVQELRNTSSAVMKSEQLLMCYPFID